MPRFLLTLLVVLLLPAVAWAQNVPKEKMVFQAATSEAAMEKTIDEAIEQAIDDMSFITKPIARGRLENTNTAVQKMLIDYDGNTVTIQAEDQKPVSTPAGGKKTRWTRGDGETFTVSQTVKPGEIEQIFYADEGTKIVRYQFSNDYQTMTMHVTLKSPKLSGPLTYALTYKR